MDHLSKQQLVLVALLVSFVTSLATGIVTVALMDQAPQGVVHTISQVIQKEIVPQDAAVAGAVPITFQDQTADAVSKASKSIVRLRDRNTSLVAGLGLVMTKAGVILADKSSIAAINSYEAVMLDGSSVPLFVIQSETSGDIAFLAPSTPVASSTYFTPISYADAPALGQTVFDIFGTSTPVLGQGIVTSVNGSDTFYSVSTNIPASKTNLGSALFDINGNVIGFETTALSQNETAAFYPVAQLKSVLPGAR